MGIAEPDASRAQPGQDYFGRVSHRGVTWVSLQINGTRPSIQGGTGNAKDLGSRVVRVVR